MRFEEFSAAGVKADEMRMNALKRNKEVATKAVQVEKNRQQIKKGVEMQKNAQKAIQTIKPIAPK